jgi:diguanylate cyclase (GGDEF)-like protein
VSMNKDELAILIVDDMKLSCTLVRQMLTNVGYADIRIANTPSESLQMLQQRPADVVLADWVMPEMDGLALTDRVRQLDEETDHYTSIVLLTAKEGIEPLMEAFARGVDDYLTKPPNKHEMAARVRAAGRIAHLQNGLLAAMKALRHELEERATIDELTRLGNRRGLLQRLESLLKLMESRGGAVCCGVVSLEDIAVVQERHGPKVVEEVLRSVANRLERSVRPTDLTARLSSNQFAVAMHYPDPVDVRPKNFKRLLQAINLRPVKSSAGYLSVVAAMGLCCTDARTALPTASGMLDCAVAKLDAARATGCTEVAF